MTLSDPWPGCQASRGFVSDSWAFLFSAVLCWFFVVNDINLLQVLQSRFRVYWLRVSDSESVDSVDAGSVICCCNSDSILCWQSRCAASSKYHDIHIYSTVDSSRLQHATWCRWQVVWRQWLYCRWTFVILCLSNSSTKHIHACCITQTCSCCSSTTCKFLFLSYLWDQCSIIRVLYNIIR